MVTLYPLRHEDVLRRDRKDVPFTTRPLTDQLLHDFWGHFGVAKRKGLGKWEPLAPPQGTLAQPYTPLDNVNTTRKLIEQDFNSRGEINCDTVYYLAP